MISFCGCTSHFSFLISHLGKALWLTLAFYVFFQEHVFPIVDGIGELTDPVAQDHEACVARQLDVELNMAVPKDEVVDIGMLLHILLGIEHQVLAVFTFIHGIIVFLMLHIAVFGPRLTNADAPSGMDIGEQPLAHRIVEDGTEHLERTVGVAQTVAVGQEELMAVYLCRHGFLV